MPGCLMRRLIRASTEYEATAYLGDLLSCRSLSVLETLTPQVAKVNIAIYPATIHTCDYVPETAVAE